MNSLRFTIGILLVVFAERSVMLATAKEVEQPSGAKVGQTDTPVLSATCAGRGCGSHAPPTGI